MSSAREDFAESWQNPPRAGLHPSLCIAGQELLWCRDPRIQSVCRIVGATGRHGTERGNPAHPAFEEPHGDARTVCVPVRTCMLEASIDSSFVNVDNLF